MRKPDIREIISQRVNLRQSGRELVGLCPFHDDRHPSLYVNPEKGVFLCRACHEGGDVFAFIMKLDGLTFPEARRALGIDGGDHKPKPIDTRNRRSAGLLATWLNEQHLKIGAMLRELAQEIGIAQTIPDSALAESLSREWDVLSDLHEDLQHPEFASELWKCRVSIEGLTVDVEPEPLPEFPPLTESYRNYLRLIAC